MEFRILGPLEVLDDAERPVGIPGARERALVAALVIQAGRVVSADRLIDDLWGEHPPAHPANALQAVVSRVRKALGAAGPEVLVTRAPGYLLAVEPGQVDAARFGRLVAEGRRLADRDAPAAVARFEEALALWRGPPLADFAYQDFAQPEIARLEEARLAATEEKLEARLAAGGHAELVGELERLVAANPLRERLRGQLILALYRSDRQAEALAAYQDTRAVLEQELGLDPSPGLRELQQAILRQDPALTPPARPRTSGPRHNLPARLTSFVGRQQELQQLRKLLDGHRLVTLTGPGGAGKSSLALELAGSLLEVQPAGVWLVELASVDEEPALVEAVATALGIRQGPPAGATGAGGSLIDRVIDFLRANRLLLVLDNCEHLVEPCARLVDRLLRAAPGLTVLATSRVALRVPGEVVWPTPPLQLPDQATPPQLLGAHDAPRLFQERAAAARPGFQLTHDTAQVVADVCRRLDGLPLAIELAAARLRALPLAELATRLQDRFRLLTGGDRTAVGRQQTLRATVDWSYGLLGESERLLFDRLSVFAGGWLLQAAEQVCSGDGIGAEEVLDLLTGLVDQSMVIAAENGRFRMLETLRDYATARLEASGRAALVRRRHLAYYLALADRIDPQRRTPGSWTWIGGLEREGGNLQAALGWALQDGDSDSALGLAGPLGWYWFMGNQQEGRRWLARLLETTPASPTRYRARALRAYALVQAFHQPDQTERAAREALLITEELGDAWGGAVAKLLIVLGTIQRGAPAGALRLLDQAEGALHDHGDRRGEAIAWWLRLAVGGQRGDLAAAIQAGKRSLQRFRELGDTWGMSGVLTELAEQTCRTGDHQAAVAMYEESLALARSRQLRYAEQDSLVRLGMLLTRLGELDRAASLLHDALALAHGLGYQMGAATACNGLGMLASRRGDLQLATSHHQQAVTIYRELGRRAGSGGLPGLVQALSYLGACRRRLGDLAGAAGCYREALTVARQHGAPLPIAGCIEGLAGVAAAMGDAEQAARLLGTAARIREQAGAPLGEPEPGDAGSAVVSARCTLGEEAFQRAHQEGRMLDLDGVQAHIPM